MKRYVSGSILFCRTGYSLARKTRLPNMNRGSALRTQWRQRRLPFFERIARDIFPCHVRSPAFRHLDFHSRIGRLRASRKHPGERPSDRCRQEHAARWDNCHRLTMPGSSDGGRASATCSSANDADLTATITATTATTSGRRQPETVVCSRRSDLSSARRYT